MDMWTISEIAKGIFYLSICTVAVCVAGYLTGRDKFTSVQFAVYGTIMAVVSGITWLYCEITGDMGWTIVAISTISAVLILFFLGNPVINRIGRKLNGTDKL